MSAKDRRTTAAGFEGTSFPPTDLTGVAKADLAKRYAGPIYTYLREKLKLKSEDAKDITMDFIAAKLLEAGFLESFFRARAKNDTLRFHKFLAGCVKRLWITEYHRREKVGPVPEEHWDALMEDFADKIRKMDQVEYLKIALGELEPAWEKIKKDAELWKLLGRTQVQSVDAEKAAEEALLAKGISKSKIWEIKRSAKEELREKVKELLKREFGPDWKIIYGDWFPKSKDRKPRTGAP